MIGAAPSRGSLEGPRSCFPVDVSGSGFANKRRAQPGRRAVQHGAAVLGDLLAGCRMDFWGAEKREEGRVYAPSACAAWCCSSARKPSAALQVLCTPQAVAFWGAKGNAPCKPPARHFLIPTPQQHRPPRVSWCPPVGPYGQHVPSLFTAAARLDCHRHVTGDAFGQPSRLHVTAGRWIKAVRGAPAAELGLL